MLGVHRKLKKKRKKKSQKSVNVEWYCIHKPQPLCCICVPSMNVCFFWIVWLRSYICFFCIYLLASWHFTHFFGTWTNPKSSEMLLQEYPALFYNTQKFHWKIAGDDNKQALIWLEFLISSRWWYCNTKLYTNSTSSCRYWTRWCIGLWELQCFLWTQYMQ